MMSPLLPAAGRLDWPRGARAAVKGPMLPNRAVSNAEQARNTGKIVRENASGRCMCHCTAGLQADRGKCDCAAALIHCCLLHGHMTSAGAVNCN